MCPALGAMWLPCVVLAGIAQGSIVEEENRASKDHATYLPKKAVYFCLPIVGEYFTPYLCGVIKGKRYKAT